MATIKEYSGNIFNSDADAIVVTVNCVGFMGKGMALECALRYPLIEAFYKQACKAQEVQIGQMLWLKREDRRWIVLFPTKTDYKFPSKMMYIDQGLGSLIDGLRNHSIGRVAVPRLGSELGGLDWGQVRPLVLSAFEDTGVDLDLWTFGKDAADPLLENLKNKLINERESATREVKVTLEQITQIVAFLEQNKSSAVTDLLSIPGVGKATVKKLVEWANVPTSNPELTLFD